MESSSSPSQTFPIQQSDIKFSDLAGLTEQKQALTESISIPLKYPQLFSGLRRPYAGFLLYGPPGVGKTLLAKACAGEFGMGYILVQCCPFIGQFMGESERKIKEIFEDARKAEKPVIIIMDEIEAMMPERKEIVTLHPRFTEFLIQMDGLANEKAPGQVFVIATANTPWDLSPRVERRLSKRIYLPLADFDTRKEIFEKKLNDIPNTLKADDFSHLAQITEGYSSQDLVVILQEAISRPIREMTKTTHFKKVDDKYFPCRETDPEAQKMSMMDIAPEELGPIRKITIVKLTDDVKEEVEKLKLSVLSSDVVKYEKYKEDYGG